jgi:gliding motility-associated-like protein
MLSPYGLANVTKYEFEVFNRWGQKVFTTTDKTKAWDGRFNGSDSPVGVYAWRLKATMEGKDIQKAGNITLLR